MNNNQSTPPSWIDRLVRGICASHKAEEVIGDLHERYALQVQRLGEKKARRRYLKESISYMRWSNIKGEKMNSKTPQALSLLRHYLLMAFRVTTRNRAFTVINVSGLALGMACFLLIFLWTTSEQEVDNFHANQDDLYTLYQTTYDPSSAFSSYMLQHFGSEQHNYLADLDEDLKNQFPEVLHVSQYATSYELPWGRAMTFQVGDKKRKIEGATAGEDFFKMFSYPLVAGKSEERR